MSAEGDPLPLRAALLRAAAAFLLSVAGSAAVLLAQGREYAETRLLVLGAGSSLSVLLIAGEARVLFATGDDPTAFGNALAAVQPVAARRLDVLLAAGTGRDRNVPAALAADPHVRSLATIGPIGDEPTAPALAAAPDIGPARRLVLPDNLRVLVETAPADPGEDAGGWRAIVERGNTRALLVSDGEALGALPSVGPVQAAVVLGADPEAALTWLDAGALVVSAAATSPAALREAIAVADRPPAQVRQVVPGEAVALSFVDGGLAIPRDGLIPLPASPVPAPDAEGDDAEPPVE